MVPQFEELKLLKSQLPSTESAESEAGTKAAVATPKDSSTSSKKGSQKQQQQKQKDGVEEMSEAELRYAWYTCCENRYHAKYWGCGTVRIYIRSDSKSTTIAKTIRLDRRQRLLDEKGFFEIETPVLHSVSGGAEARPFETYHNAMDINLTLRIATELHLKTFIGWWL